MSKLGPFMVAGLLGLTGLSSAALAHPKLASALPDANSTVTTVPNELRLKFNEELEASFSGAEIKGDDDRKIETGKASTDPKDSTQLVIPLQSPLSAGTYTVTWHAVGADSHKVKGSYSFTVKP